MPLYEFECALCGHVYEEILASGAVAPPCPECGSQNARRLVSCPSPLKSGAFPFKPGPVHPLAMKWAAGGGCAGGSCGSCAGAPDGGVS